MSLARLSFRPRMLAPFVGALAAGAGFPSPSCASPRMPAGGDPLRSAAAGYEMRVLVDGAPVPTFDRAGETYVLGRLGARYTLRIINHTGQRIEAVTSIDGRDAIDGKPADVRTKRGYLVPAWGSVDIDGWRVSRADVAAFRFSSVADSYAARTGSAREVGVIGVAVFPERFVPSRRVDVPLASPRSQGELDDQGEMFLELFSSSAAGKASALRERHAIPPSTEAIRDSSSAPANGSPSAPSRLAAERGPQTAAAAIAGGVDTGAGSAPRRRPGLGTEFGEVVRSPIQEVIFTRADPTRPSVVLGARYDEREGLLALGIDLDGCCSLADELARRQAAKPFPNGARRYAAPPAGWRNGCCVGY